VYTSLENARILGNASPAKVSLIIAELTPGANKKQLINDINQLYPTLKAWDAKAIQQSTVKEILITSNMGMSFGTLVLFAMISGFFIIGLTLYSSALDRIKDYGTLKAIGAKKKYVNRLIVTQASLAAQQKVDALKRIADLAQQNKTNQEFAFLAGRLLLSDYNQSVADYHQAQQEVWQAEYDLIALLME